MRNRVWAAFAKSLGPPLGGSVVAVDPASGLITDTIQLDGDPRFNSIALSGNGRYLYLALADAGEIVRVDLVSPGNPGVRILLGTTLTPWFARDIEVLDGDGASFVASFSGSFAYVFDGTVRRANGTSSYSVERIERTTTPNVFVGAQVDSSLGQLSRLTVTASGVSVTANSYGVMPLGYYGDMRASGDFVLGSSGVLAESPSLTLQGNFSSSGAPCLDVLNGRAYLATGTSLRSYEITSGTLLTTLTLPGPVADSSYTSSPSLIRWGVDGLALTGASKLYLLRSSVAVAPDVDQNGDHVSDAWEVTYFGATNVDLAADPDGDGVANVFEYFFGTSPLANNGNPMQIGGIAGGEIHLIYSRRAGISPSYYRYEVSADLGQWSMPTGVTESVLGTQTVNGVQVQTIDAAITPPSSPRSFARLKWLGAP